MGLNKLILLILDILIGNFVNVVLLGNVFSDLFEPVLSNSTGVNLALLNLLIYVILPILLGELIKHGIVKLFKNVLS